MTFNVNNNIAFLVVLSFYEVVGMTLLVMAEFKISRVRLYFDFLNTKTGRSAFIAFTELLIIDGTGAVIIIIGIIVFIMAFIGIIYGWT